MIDSVLSKLVGSGKETKASLASINSTLQEILTNDKKTAKIEQKTAKRKAQDDKRNSGDKPLKRSKVAAEGKKGKNDNKIDEKALGKALGDALAVGGGLGLAATAIPGAGALAASLAGLPALTRAITGLEDLVSNQEGSATIGEGSSARQINRGELRDKLITMRSVRSRGTFGGEELTEQQNETLQKNITLLEQLSNRMGETKSVNDQLYRKNEQLKNTEKGTEEFDKLTAEIAELNHNLTQSKKIQKSLISQSNLDPELARRDTLKPREMLQGIPWAVSDKDKEEIAKLKADGKWTPSMDDIIQGRQFGGHVINASSTPFTVPGISTGDNYFAELEDGSFVKNRNSVLASNALQRGGIPCMLESGEEVYGPGQWGMKEVMDNICFPRFPQHRQTGGEVTQTSHPQTGSGWQPAGGTDASGRPLIFSKPAAESFAEMMDDGGVKSVDVASSQRSPSHNSTVGGAANSAHLYGEAMDIHNSSKSWMISNSERYGWKRNNYMNDSWHWDYTGKGSGGNDNAKKAPSQVILAAGTNDFNSPGAAGENVNSMVNTLQQKNYKTKFISPVNTGKFAEVSSSTTQGAKSAGANTYMPTSWDSDGHHIDPSEAKNIKKATPNAIVIGDSNAARIEGSNGGVPDKIKVGAGTETIKGFVNALTAGISNESGEKSSSNATPEGKKKFSFIEQLSGLGGGVGDFLGSYLGAFESKMNEKGLGGIMSAIFGSKDDKKISDSKGNNNNNSNNTSPAGDGKAIPGASTGTKNEKAVLDAIAHAEGTYNQPNHGYNTHFAFDQTEDLSAHPAVIKSGGGYRSDAFGRYQFMSPTWGGIGGAVKPHDGKPEKSGMDMSPKNQDEGALKLVKARGVDVNDGLSNSEILNLGKEWASVKGGGYNQDKYDEAAFKKLFVKYGGNPDGPSKNISQKPENQPMMLQKGGVASMKGKSGGPNIAHKSESQFIEKLSSAMSPMVVPIPMGGNTGGSGGSGGNSSPAIPSLSGYASDRVALENTLRLSAGIMMA